MGTLNGDTMPHPLNGDMMRGIINGDTMRHHVSINDEFDNTMRSDS
jgi:hypothetical protein